MTRLPPDQPGGGSAAAPEGSTAGWPSGHPTGHPRVDDLMAALDATGDLPPAERVAPLSEADRALRETLDSIGDV